jgi:hypothetical protein
VAELIQTNTMLTFYAVALEVTGGTINPSLETFPAE